MDVTAFLANSVLVCLGIGLIATFVSEDLRARTLLLFAIHAGFALLFYSLIGLWSPDAELYNQQAKQLVDFQAGRLASAPRVTLGKEGWPTLLAVLYGYISPSPQLGLVVNAIFSALCLPIVVALGEIVGAGRQAAKKVSWFLFFPPFIVWGSLLLREAGMWFFLLLAALGAARMATRHVGPSTVVMFAVGALGMAAFRASGALIAIVAMVVSLVISSRAPGIIRASVTIGALALSPVILSFVAASALTDTESLARSQSSLAESGSGFASSSLASLPMGVARALGGPFPWEWPGLSPIYIIDWLTWVPAVVLAVLGSRYGKNVFHLAAPAMGLLAALAFTSGNYGTMIRLRDSALVLIIPIAALYFAKREESRDGLDLSVSGRASSNLS